MRSTHHTLSLTHTYTRTHTLTRPRCLLSSELTAAVVWCVCRLLVRYWMYIVPFGLFVLLQAFMGQEKAPEGGGGQVRVETS